MNTIVKTNTKKIKTNSIFSGIENSRGVLTYYMKLMNKSFEEEKKLISGYNIKELIDHFGKHSYTVETYRIYKIWELEFRGVVFKLEVNKDYGTGIIINKSFEDISSGKCDDLIISFLNEFYKIINK